MTLSSANREKLALNVVKKSREKGYIGITIKLIRKYWKWLKFRKRIN